jgi:16S rRNA (cytosine1402-N4)-methyltransferase
MVAKDTKEKIEKTKQKDKKTKKVTKKKTIELDKFEEQAQKLEEINDKYLRLNAEFDNFRKRTLKEKMDLIKSAGEDILINILPVLDNFERAIEASKKAKDIDAVMEGVNLIYTNYESFPKWVAENKPELKFTGILMDLGVSSHQFDTFERGFSFRSDAPLDMRMDYKNDDVGTAADILNNYDEEDIANLIFKYGEERLSRRIAAEIVERRKEEPITRTKQLEDICFHAYPKKMRFGKTHPATRTFQALRIAVNDELGVLENTLQGLFDILDVGGTLAVISFHSLEDRIVKHKFKEIFQTDKNIAKILSKRPILPSEDEVLENKRSRSAKLRLIKKLG